MKILNLPIKKQWFDMIKSGDKTEEYRDLKDHWMRRLVWFKGKKYYYELDEFLNDLASWEMNYQSVKCVFCAYGAFSKKFDIVRFRNGYRKEAPVIDVEFKNFRVGHGDETWGAEPGQKYFVIELGKIL